MPERQIVYLPPLIRVMPVEHEGWRQRKLRAGVTSHRSRITGKELMVPWEYMADLDKAEELFGLRSMYATLDMLSHEYDFVESKQ